MDTSKQEQDEQQEHKIMSLPQEKRDRIINAALAEFNGGFKHASTDAIVKAAGISKGLLFHYFGCKESLYEFICLYAVDTVVREYYEMIDFSQRDLIERMWQAILLKVDLSYKYPLLFDFLTTAYQENHNGMSTRMQQSRMLDMMTKMINDIDTTLFKDGVDPAMAVNVIMWTQTGYSTSQLAKVQSRNLADFQSQYTRFLEEIQGYFDLFRKTFYK